MFLPSRNREDNFIVGLSMGGYGALVNGLKYYERFSHIGVFSLIFLNSCKAYYLMSQLIKREEKIPVTYKEEPGSHNWEYWDKILADFLEWLPLEELEVGFGSGHVISKTN